METIRYVTEAGNCSRPIPVRTVEWLVQSMLALRLAAENAGARRELALARRRRRVLVADAEQRAAAADVAVEARPAGLALSVAAIRPPEDGTTKDLLDRLLRGIGQLKRIADQAGTAVVRDAERRRVEWAQRKLRK